MDGTPKLQRKASLSLSTRLNKRHSASPQHHLKVSLSGGEVPRSPSVISISSDGGIECTPPHKKIDMNMDDSLDYSPKVFDSSFSPSCMLSQTLARDSPEVGWKWSRCNENGGPTRGTTSTRTPDSAYAADSSFTSAGSSSTEMVLNIRTRCDNYKQRLNYDVKQREEQRKVFEQQLRRVEKTRAEEKLKQRCAKLQEQLNSAGTQNSTNKIAVKKAAEENMDMSQTNVAPNQINNTANTMIPKKTTPVDSINDFFNDSDTDCFLLAATQEIETQMDCKTQTQTSDFKNSNSSKGNALLNEKVRTPQTTSPLAAVSSSAVTSSAATSSPVSTSITEKRSSFYTKFHEDDCSDDWFTSLDWTDLEATQSKKPRTSLQRYKSMPTDRSPSTASVAKRISVDANSGDSGVSSSKSTSDKSSFNSRQSSSLTLSRMKRHSSSHSLSPSVQANRGRLQPRK